MNFALEENPPNRDFKLNKKNEFTFIADIVGTKVGKYIHCLPICL